MTVEETTTKIETLKARAQVKRLEAEKLEQQAAKLEYDLSMREIRHNNTMRLLSR